MTDKRKLLFYSLFNNDDDDGDVVIIILLARLILWLVFIRLERLRIMGMLISSGERR